MLVDLFLVYNFVKRLATPFDEWDAYDLGIIDERGNILKKTRELKTMKEKDAFGKFDLMILNLKKLIEKIPGGKSRIGSYAAALYLIKEGYDDAENEELVSLNFNKYLQELMKNEDAPANSIGSGNIASKDLPLGDGETLKRRKKKKVFQSEKNEE